ncbi:MAG: LysR family transcriptional regulator [Myxococcota bacterium]
MERLRRVMRLWDWLPAFRAVAETEHLTNAAHQLHVTPPAVSRTLKVLEDDLGQPLFERRGRGLQLNAAGARLLGAVRIAMRVVHDAVQDVEAGLQLDVTVASAGVFTVTGLCPMLEQLTGSHPNVRPRVRTSPLIDPAGDLLQGHVDLVFTSSALFRDGLTTVPLCKVTTGVYCAAGHPLFGRTDVDRDEIGRHPFVAPPSDAQGVPIDGWPGEWRRKVAVEVDRQAIGIDIALGGSLLAVLPDLMVRSHPQLWRLPLDVPSTTAVFAIHRETVSAPGPVEAAVVHAREVLRSGLDPRFIQDV